MDNFNTKLNNLKSDLVTIINQSDIPVGAVYYLVKDLLAEIEGSYKQTLLIEEQVEQINQLENSDEENN